MKKFLFLFAALSMASVGFAQKTLEFHQAQTRIIEPMQDVLVRPLVADLEIIKQERVTYPASWQFKDKKLAELTMADLEDAKTLACYLAAANNDADVIVGATFEVRNHIENKGGKQQLSDYGVDIIVRGYPAKYTNWHKMGEKPEDAKWVTNLIDAQRARINSNEQQKTQAVK